MYSETTLIQVQNGKVLLRNGIKCSYEEEDINIIMQLFSCVEKIATQETSGLCVKTQMSLCCFPPTYQDKNKIHVTMESFESGQALVDINKTAQMKKNINSSLIAAHALSGCDSVHKLFGIDKKKVSKVLTLSIQH